MRLIDADAMLETLKRKYPQWYTGKPKDSWMHYAWLVYHQTVENAPTIDAIPRWIPCEERLPKDLEVVNITWINHRPATYYADIKDNPFTATAIHYEDKWWWYSPICEDMLAECGKSECDKMDANIEVTAWMPMPEPYNGERKDDDIL